MRIILFNNYSTTHILLNKTMPKKTTALALTHSPFHSRSIVASIVYEMNNENILSSGGAGRSMVVFTGKMYFSGQIHVFYVLFNSQFTYTCREVVETFIKPKWISFHSAHIYFFEHSVGSIRMATKKAQTREREKDRHAEWILSTAMPFQLYVLLLTKPWNNASLICWTLPNGKCMLFLQKVSFLHSLMEIMPCTIHTFHTE